MQRNGRNSIKSLRHFHIQKIQTHITTNLSASEIETLYVNRVRSRLRELCNLITYDRQTIDKRK